MKEPEKFPELDDAIAAHARAVCASDFEAAEAFATSGVLTAHRRVFSAERIGSSADFIELGRARIGFQFVSKIRFTSGKRMLLMLIRWRREEDAKWRIAEIEDLSGKRSPWSDIPPIGAPRPENRDA